MSTPGRTCQLWKRLGLYFPDVDIVAVDQVTLLDAINEDDVSTWCEPARDLRKATRFDKATDDEEADADSTVADDGVNAVVHGSSGEDSDDDGGGFSDDGSEIDDGDFEAISHEGGADNAASRDFVVGCGDLVIEASLADHDERLSGLGRDVTATQDGDITHGIALQWGLGGRDHDHHGSAPDDSQARPGWLRRRLLDCSDISELEIGAEVFEFDNSSFQRLSSSSGSEGEDENELTGGGIDSPLIVDGSPSNTSDPNDAKVDRFASLDDHDDVILDALVDESIADNRLSRRVTTIDDITTMELATRPTPRVRLQRTTGQARTRFGWRRKGLGRVNLADTSRVLFSTRPQEARSIWDQYPRSTMLDNVSMADLVVEFGDVH